MDGEGQMVRGQKCPAALQTRLAEEREAAAARLPPFFSTFS